MARAAYSPLGAGAGQVEGVLGGAEAGQLGVDPRAARQRMLELLEHQDAAALAASGALAPRVEGLDGGGRVVARRRDRADHAEGHGVQRRQARVGAAADRHQRVAVMHVRAASPIA